MTAASTRRHKRRVAPGSGQNKRHRAAQSTQSQTTGSTSSSSSGGNPNYLGYTLSQPDRSQQEGSTSTGAFVKRGRAPVCVSLRRRFGKTFNLSTIEEFLNVVNSSDAHPVNGQMDEQACHWAREGLFEGTLLEEREPELLSQCFCKHTVIRLELKPPGTAAVECLEDPRWRAPQGME
ncbi:hypothetical protein GQ54DRAFT_300198, partial [Martensiomyces pterosporus]